MAAGSSTKISDGIVPEHEEVLLSTAAGSITYGLAYGEPLSVTPEDFPAALAATGGSFVTLERRGSLRGCIGSIQAYRPLITDVAENAFGAAFRDPRFKPLALAELQEVTYSISILSPMQPMTFESEEDLISQLVPEETGLVIRDQSHRAVFLPQVWESLPEPMHFLRRLKVKAHLAENHWSDTMQAWRFQVAKTRTADFPAKSAP